MLPGLVIGIAMLEAFRAGGLRNVWTSLIDAFSICWAAWIEWAGLRQIVELRCDS